MSIPTDDNAISMSDDAAVSALMETLGGKPKPHVNDDDAADDTSNGDEDGDDAQEASNADDGDEDDGGNGEDEDGDDQDGEDSDDGEGGEDPDPKEGKAALEIADDTELTIKVNGEEQKVTIGSLKRLAGQEASLTRKSQEADLVGGRAAAALQLAIETAMEDLQPYKDVDWLVLQGQMEPEEFAWHRTNAERARQRFEKLTGAAGSVEQVLTERQKNAKAAEAAEAIKVLQADIPEWSDKLYGEILDFGIKAGLPEADVSSITSPVIIKLLRQAMLYEAGEKAVAKKVAQAPAKVLKGGKRNDPAPQATSVKKAMSRLASGEGTDADAIAALAGRWA